MKTKQELVKLQSAVKRVYFAGVWECSGVGKEEQAEMWEQLRDACGIKPGSATRKRVAP